MTSRLVPIMAALVLVAACGSTPLGSRGTDTVIEVTAAPTPGASASVTEPTAAPTEAPPTPFPAPADIGLDDIALGPDGQLYGSSCVAARVYRIVGDHQLQVVIGSGGSGFDTGFTGDGGPATDAQVSCPIGIVFDNAGELVLADHSNNRIRRVDANGIIQTIAGSGEAGSNRGMYGGDGGPATSGFLQEPTQIAFDAAGNLYISDRDNNRVRKVDANGILTTLAGDGADAFGGDGGPSTKSKVDDPAGIAVAPDGTVYFADSNNRRVRKVDPNGIITTIAGTAKGGDKGDGGPASKATFDDPEALALDAEGNLYVSDGPVVRIIDSKGRISRFAGTGVAGTSGDGGPATKALLTAISSIVVAPNGDVYLDDGDGHQIRKVAPDGTISTVFSPS